MVTAFESIARGGSKILWLASSGGHLVQATRIEQLLGPNPESVWVTNDVPQARSLLDGRNAHFIDYVAPRDLLGSVRAAMYTSRVVRAENPDQIISTGAAIAAVAVPWLAARGYPATFIESVARKTSHSLTGRVCVFAPRVRTLTQYEDRTSAQWHYEGTVLSGWSRTHLAGVSERPLRIFVTLGTIKPYRFDRAVDAVLSMLNPQDEIVWQLGETTRDKLPGRTYSELGANDTLELMRWADVVIMHAGVGSILDALSVGKAPVLVARRASHKEHVDNHQQDILEEMVSRSLGEALSPETPLRAVLYRAAASVIESGVP